MTRIDIITALTTAVEPRCASRLTQPGEPDRLTTRWPRLVAAWVAHRIHDHDEQHGVVDHAR